MGSDQTFKLYSSNSYSAKTYLNYHQNLKSFHHWLSKLSSYSSGDLIGLVSLNKEVVGITAILGNQQVTTRVSVLQASTIHLVAMASVDQSDHHEVA